MEMTDQENLLLTLLQQIDNCWTVTVEDGNVILVHKRSDVRIVRGSLLKAVEHAMQFYM